MSLGTATLAGSSSLFEWGYRPTIRVGEFDLLRVWPVLSVGRTVFENWQEASEDLAFSTIDPCDASSIPTHRFSDTIPASIVPPVVSVPESTAFSNTRLHPLNNSDGVLFCVPSAIANKASLLNGYSSGSLSLDL